MINDVDSLPRTARSLQLEMLRQQDKSLLSVPVFHQGILRACIGFDATAASRRWGAETIKALAECAHLIALARYSSHAGESVKPFAPLFYLRLQGRVRGVAPEDIIGVRSAGDYSDLSISDGSVTTDRRGLSACCPRPRSCASTAPRPSTSSRSGALIVMSASRARAGRCVCTPSTGHRQCPALSRRTARVSGYNESQSRLISYRKELSARHEQRSVDFLSFHRTGMSFSARNLWADREKLRFDQRGHGAFSACRVPVSVHRRSPSTPNSPASHCCRPARRENALCMPLKIEMP